MLVDYLTFALFFIIFLFFFIYYYLFKPLSYWKKRGVLGPDPLPFFGNLKESALRRKHVGLAYKEIYNDYPGEKYVGILRMTSPTLIIRDLDIVKHILIKDFEAFPYRGFDFSNEGLGDNLFHANYDTWKAIKHKMTPYFTSEKLKSTMYLLTERGDKFVDYLESICLKQKNQEVIELFQKYTIATIMAFAFGIEVETIYDNFETFKEIDKSFFKSSYWNELDLLFPGIMLKTNSSLFNKLVNRFCYEVVEAVNCQRNGKPSPKNDLMDLMLALKIEGEAKSLKRNNDDDQVCLKVTDHVIAGQVFVFFAAGYGNNSIVLSNAMFHLAKRPEVQDKLFSEIEEVLQRYNGELTYEAIKEMTYLDYTFLETLRFHPTTNSIARYAVKDYKIPETDLIIEKGVSVVISPLAIQHDESIYPNPENFDPERFTPEKSKNRHSCAYLPFGVGPRTCLGECSFVNFT